MDVDHPPPPTGRGDARRQASSSGRRREGDSSGARSGRGCSRVSTSTTPDHRPGNSGPGPPRCSTHRPPWTASGRSGRSVTARQPAPSSWPSTRGDGSTTHRESTRCAREPASASRSSTSRPRACGSNPPLSRRLRVLGPTTRRWRCSVTSCSNGVPPPPSTLPAASLPNALLHSRTLSPAALERRYLCDVERANGLPRGRRQCRARSGGALVVHDLEYAGQATLVELDERLGHELADRWADLGRDLASLRRGTVTLRAGWGQVLQPCRLAEAVGAVLLVRAGLPPIPARPAP